ncbi:interleukin-21 receptor-like isoform X2 [Megalops cyprinoides]|uniref:interleukin-21 receptor-like isoform X2 n=1 Tax=Megalops cyprinoides TaxID=118141 RepID=UPI001863D60B|nr:interleukin-21 receptor-like isoform X2 [Megalops cyprinoides]
MRIQVAIISLVFCGLIQHTTCACNVNCTTDYISSLNCSCSGQAPAPSYHLEAECWYTDEVERFHASCEVVFSQRWCEIQLDTNVYSIGADSECTVRVKNTNGEWSLEPDNFTHLLLYNHIKPQPPFNVTLTESDGTYNVSWKVVYTENENIYLHEDLIYRVRIRSKDKTEPEHLFEHENTRYLEIPTRIFQGSKQHMVDVQAKVNPDTYEHGDWSEWSPTAEWTTRDDEGVKEDYRLYFLLTLIVLPCVLCFFRRRFWLKKVQVYIPSPEFFFQPLYHAYEGDFKKWVGPAFTFSEADFLEKNMVVPVVKEKQLKSLEKLCEGEDSSCMTGMGSGLFHSSCKHICSQGLDTSAGHISIDTVTVSGEENADLGGSRDPYRGSCGDCFEYPAYSPGESKEGSEGERLLGAQGRREAVICGGRVSSRAETSRDPSSPLGLDSLEWHLDGEYNELEQLSLDISEHSEDGYPAVVLDMDTIDSGFLESDCNSPVHSELDGKEQMEALALAEVQHCHTNYVKQWVATTSPPAMQDSTS